MSLEQLLAPMEIPKMARIRQSFPRPTLSDIPMALRETLARPQILGRIKSGDRVAVTAGSRGIANIALILREVVANLKAVGAEPFIIPAMGSHGGATAEGQVEVLRSLGISEKTVGAPIHASMDVVQVGESAGGIPVYFDKYAATKADATVVVGRVKPHTSFHGSFESGLAKMIAIGLGKQKGAEICHAAGPAQMSRRIEDIARVALEQSNVIFGVGILENAYDETSKIVALPREEILAREPGLLQEARGNLPHILFSEYDVLIVDEIGKNISGLGMDTNIINRFPTPAVKCEPTVQRIVVLDLTEETHGNFHGLGLADVCTRRVFEKLDFNQTYPNPLTSRVPEASKIPVVMPSDLLAIKAAIQTCCEVDYNTIKMVRIKNTLKLDEIFISEHLLAQARLDSRIEIVGDLRPMHFAENGSLLEPW
ncbi:lactate racemase domain-containing protein [Paradesulfitobacterium aromaticivorans]